MEEDSDQWEDLRDHSVIQKKGKEANQSWYLYKETKKFNTKETLEFKNIKDTTNKNATFK